MPSSASEKRLMPSIHVTIHPTVEVEKKEAASDEKPESSSDQEAVEKLIGAKITGGIEFNMPLTIFDVITWNDFRLLALLLIFRILQGRQRIESGSHRFEVGRRNCFD